MLNYEIEVPAIIADYVAQEIADFVRAKPTAVIGPITGNSPLMVYDKLAYYKSQGLDFSKTTWIGLDEYYPIDPRSPLSYHDFLQTRVARPLNIGKLYTLNGRERSLQEITDDCKYYERMIKKLGGIDLQLLGVGRTGHIGFNEPGSEEDSRTRLILLHPVTRMDATREFGCIEKVPQSALTQGVATLKGAKRILFIALDEKKAPIVNDALTLPPTPSVPATFVRDHPRITYYLGHDAAAQWQRTMIKLRGHTIGKSVNGNGFGNRS